MSLSLYLFIFMFIYVYDKNHDNQKIPKDIQFESLS